MARKRHVFEEKCMLLKCRISGNFRNSGSPAPYIVGKSKQSLAPLHFRIQAFHSLEKNSETTENKNRKRNISFIKAQIDRDPVYTIADFKGRGKTRKILVSQFTPPSRFRTHLSPVLLSCCIVITFFIAASLFLCE